jgi:hypothetical protein
MRVSRKFGALGRGGLLVSVAVMVAVANLLWFTPAKAASNPEMVSVDNTGGKIYAVSSQISDDGTKVAFMADGDENNPPRIYLHDRATDSTVLISTDGDGELIQLPSGTQTLYRLSGNAQKLVINASDAVYVKDIQTGDYEAVSLGPDGSPVDPDRAYISDDGTLVAWGGYVRNLVTETTIELEGRAIELSGNGQYVFMGDQNFVVKVALSDLSEESFSVPRVVDVSDDGRYLLSDVVRNIALPGDVRRYDTVDHTDIEVVNEAGQYHINGQIDMSGDGNVVAFSSFPYNNGSCCQTSRNKIFVKIISTGEEFVATKNVYGNPTDQSVASQSDNMLTQDGSQITYATHASNLGVLGPNGFLAYVQDVENAPPIVEDTTAPEISGTPALSQSTVDRGESVTVTATGTDDTSGVVYGEFYLWDGSAPPTFAPVIGFPGQVAFGHGTPMPLTGGELAGTIDTTDVDPGTYYVRVRIQDDAGNWSTEVAAQLTIEGEIDTEIPVAGTPSWSLNPKAVLQTSTLTVPATDDLEVIGGEYYLGDSDPGQGGATSMGWDGTNLTAVFGTDLPTGVHKITIRAVDSAGNWSEPVTDYLVVYNPDGARMTGRRVIVPSLANGDVLPGLIAADQDDRATFAFNVRYNNQGQITNGSDLQFNYETGRRCNGNNPVNCHDLRLNATSIAWLVTQGQNDSEGIFEGVANLRVDGVLSTAVFRVTGLDGGRLNPTSPDHFMLKIYAEGANPNTDTPMYQVSSEVARGNIRIIF